MKKLLLFAAIGMLASPALAQNNDTSVNQSGTDNTATVDQNGVNNEAFVDQFTNPDRAGVDAVVTQTGTSQLADVEQTGSSPNAYAEVVQGDGTGTGSNEAYITQQRSQNAARAIVHQAGTENHGRVFQSTGGLNEAEIYQGQTDDTSAENHAEITQDRESVSPLSTLARVYQDGFSNEAYVDQSLTINANVEIDQDGDENWADVDQQNTDRIDPNHQADVRQLGDLNKAQVLQEGFSSSRNTAEVRQLGDSNHAFLDQDGNGGSHVMQITQDGNGNEAGNEATSLSQSGFNHFLDIDQIGDSNIVTSTQMGSGHTETVMQVGNGNTANVMQSN